MKEIHKGILIFCIILLTYHFHDKWFCAGACLGFYYLTLVPSDYKGPTISDISNSIFGGALLGTGLGTMVGPLLKEIAALFGS